MAGTALTTTLLLAAATAIGQDAATRTADIQCRRPHLQQMAMMTPDLPSDTSSCLIDAAKVTPSMHLVDLRGRQEYVDYHATGAHNQQLNQLMSQRPQGIVVYDGGRLRQDAALLCTRLQRYGLRDVRVVDGGIAALARQRGAVQSVALSRLDDNEVTAAMLSGSARVQSLAPAHGELIASLGIASTTRGQTVLLAQQQSQVAARFSAGKAASGVYWVGDASRLRQLLQNSQAQERKREQGPGYNPNCAAL